MITKGITKLCKDYTKIENYDKAVNDTDRMWVLHHRLETHFSDGTERPKDMQLSATTLISLHMYYHRPPEELIFLTNRDHTSLHKRGKHLSEDQKRRLSESLSKRKLSKEHRRKISRALKGNTNNKGKPLSEETKRKISESMKVSWQNKSLH